MPIYEFECPVHGIFEKMLPIKEADTKNARCNVPVSMPLRCGLLSERVWSLTGNINIGKPTRVFIDQRTGNAFTPANEYEKAPRGCREIELRNPVERSQFEKEQQRMVDAKNEVTSHALNAMKDEATKKRHDDLKSRMNAVQKDIDPITGKEIRYTLDEKSKDLLKKSMNRSRDKKERTKKSDVMLAINHTDKGNLSEDK